MNTNLTPAEIEADFKIPTNEGDKTITEVIDYLMWVSYKTNRDLGCSHQGLVNIGIGNELTRLKYETPNI